ncbi:hypothetical protein ABMA27_001351 [Loxostege sticticalis]|uniref:FLYWCH-type domain-containing protein n=1 Tax=Loxostege sticticalis TaxID=481309 RepID=A0ABR3HY59_LOXSC
MQLIGPKKKISLPRNEIKGIFSGVQFKMINSSRGGFLLMLDGFTFNKQTSKGKFWVCTSKCSSRCEAKVRLENPTTVVPYNLTHNHRPPSYHITKDGRYIKDFCQCWCFISYVRVSVNFSCNKEKRIEFKMIHSSRGAHYMMVNSFTFKKQDSKARTWICTSRPASKCLAKVRMEDPNTVIPYSLEHNHPPPLYHVMKDGQYIKVNWICTNKPNSLCEAKVKLKDLKTFKMINSERGGFLIMINQFTFYKVSNRGKVWICSNNNSYQCKAKVRLVNPNTVFPYNLEHNHPPPSFHVTEDGTYVKLRK